MTSKRREDANTKAERQFDPNNQDDDGDGDATQKTTTTEEGDHRDDDDDETRTTTTEEAGRGSARTLSRGYVHHKECGHNTLHKSHLWFEPRKVKRNFGLSTNTNKVNKANNYL